MYESTLVNTPSFWYGLKRPAWSGGEKTRPAENAQKTSSASPPARRRRDGSGFCRGRGVDSELGVGTGGVLSIEAE